MLINPQYEAFFGSVERAGKHSVQTLFYHFMGFPLWPQESYVVSGNTLFGGELRVTELKRNMPSIIAGYARGWTTMGSIVLLAVGIFLFFLPKSPVPTDPQLPEFVPYVVTALGVLGLMVAAVTYVITRRGLNDVELAKRAIYAEMVGVPVDPAYLGDPWSMRDDLKRAFGEIGEAAGLGRSFDCFARWPEVAMDPRVSSPKTLRMALALTRLCVASPEKETPRSEAQLASIHEAIWQRLVQIDPSAAATRP